jgi:hypothetical protein
MELLALHELVVGFVLHELMVGFAVHDVAVRFALDELQDLVVLEQSLDLGMRERHVRLGLLGSLVAVRLLHATHARANGAGVEDVWLRTDQCVADDGNRGHGRRCSDHDLFRRHQFPHES